MDIPRLELLYELAYLRVFSAWEVFLEETFIRYLCGYTRKGVGGALLAPVPLNAPGAYAPRRQDALVKMLHGQNYVLWHNPIRVIKRAKQFFQSSPHELVVSSFQSQLQNYAAFRHRIAHDSEDARAKFDTASLALVGRLYRGSKAGRLLREIVPSTSPPLHWLERISDELVGLAMQIV